VCSDAEDISESILAVKSQIFRENMQGGLYKLFNRVYNKGT
jgi:hypothetical protein